MPTPESTNTMGMMAGSAPGARRRTATWAAANAAKSPSGTPSDSSVTGALESIRYIA